MLKKVLIGLAVLLVLLLSAAIVLPFVFKDKINARIKEEINKQLDAQVDYGSFDLSLLRSFPHFTFSMNDFSVVGKGEFRGDTLAYIQQFDFTIDVMTVINGGPYKIIAVNIDKPVVNAMVKSTGKANWDIVKPTEKKPAATTATTTSPLQIQIKKYRITDANIRYDDREGDLFADVRGLDFEGSGDVADQVYDFITKTGIRSLTVTKGIVTYLSRTNVQAAIALKVDNIGNRYTFGDNSIRLNDLGLVFSGFIKNNPDNLQMDLTFGASETQFKSILSLLPAIYQKDFEDVKTSGSLALQGSIKGVLKDENYPAFNLDVQVPNAMFQYPGLPVAVNNIRIQTNIQKPQGDLDLTQVDIRQFHAEAGDDKMDAVLTLRTPISNPDVDADIIALLNLANVPKYYPVENVKTLNGTVNADVRFKGKQSDIDNKQYEKVTAEGTVKVAGLTYDAADLPKAVKIREMEMNFTPRFVALKKFNANIGKSDINATGSLGNFMAYVFNAGELQGKLDLRCGVFDANEWLTDTGKEPAAQTSSAQAGPAEPKYFPVPRNIDFTANSYFGKIYYDKLTLEQVKGQVVIKDETIYLNQLFAKLLGGDATINAQYTTKDLDHPDVRFTYKINRFDVQQTYKLVGLAQKMAPVMQFIEGSFSSSLEGSGSLNKDMTVDYNSLNGDGKVEIPYARITQVPVLSEVSKVAKITSLNRLEMKNAWTVLRFKNGKVEVEPTDIKFGNGYNLNFKGWNGFDQSIDFDMQLDVPSKELGPAASLAQGMLAKVPGASASLPEMVGFLFKVTGTATKPQVKLNKVIAGGKSATSIVKDNLEDLKKKAEEEAKAKVYEARAKAEAELKKQREEAERKARETVDKARQEAEQKAREAAEKAKREAEQKAKEIFRLPKR